ncbi:MAG: 50S ribosomal protein L11 methyltransferase [Ignavibacteriales bacterium]|nr:50S ribosomal protein L11 methyltransferase [Ignavibacteriales bacterium]
MKTYKQYRIQTDPVDVELVSGLLWQLDLDGINETDNGLIVFAGSAKNISQNDIKNILDRIVGEGQIQSFTILEETLEDKNWNEEYEKNVRVIEVTDRIVIKPSFKDYAIKPDQIIITIDPKMSFGTGEHATTKLVLQLIDKYVLGGEKVLDVGSGTGVLGISAVMIGAQSAICIDNDEWCSLNGDENVKANHLENKVEIRLAEIQQIEENNFDLVVANINKHILLDIAEEIKRKIKKTGTLILSGLLIIDEKDIIEKYSSIGFRLLQKNEMDEWCALVLQLD